MKLAFALYGRRTPRERNNNSSLSYEEGYPWLKGEHVLYLGEIENMQGHCAVVRNGGQIYYGYHSDDFLIYKNEELHSVYEEDGTQSYVGLEDYMIYKTDPLDGKKYICLSLENVLLILNKLDKISTK